MYQSVFVIAEEKNECIIATEVNKKILWVVTFSQLVSLLTDSLYVFSLLLSGIIKPKSLFTVSVGYLVDCLQVRRDWDYLNSSCCSLKLDNWTESTSSCDFPTELKLPIYVRM